MTDKHPQPDTESTDLQARVRTLEADLQACEQRAMSLFGDAPVPYFILDAHGRIERVNAVACGLLGRAAEALIGKPFVQFTPVSARTTFARLLRQLDTDGLKQRGEVQVLHADGTPCEVQLDLSVQNAGGHSPARRILLVATDVTAHRRAHEGLLSTNAVQEETLREQALQVRLLSQELESVVTVFIQQLHPPVARALNFLGFLRSALGDAANDALRPFVGAERSVQQILALLASMDRHMEARRMRVRLRPVDLNRVLAEVLKNATPAMADRRVTVSADVLPTVQGDSRALYIVLDEYVANALKYTKHREEARIRVRVHETASEFHIGVEDNGAGFNMRQKDRLFHLFGRLHPSNDYEGTGVGLVTVRRVCERFGGRTWADGKPDQGATFWFGWPKQPVMRDV